MGMKWKKLYALHLQKVLDHPFVDRALTEHEVWHFYKSPGSASLCSISSKVTDIKTHTQPLCRCWETQVLILYSRHYPLSQLFSPKFQMLCIKGKQWKDPLLTEGGGMRVPLGFGKAPGRTDRSITHQESLTPEKLRHALENALLDLSRVRVKKPKNLSFFFFFF